MTDFKTRIKEIRNKNNLTQEAFGKLFGQSKGVIAQWEAGNNMPRLETLILICDYLNIGLDWLVRGKDFNENKKASSRVNEEGEKIQEKKEIKMEDIMSLLNEINDGQKDIKNKLGKVEEEVISSLKTISPTPLATPRKQLDKDQLAALVAKNAKRKEEISAPGYGLRNPDSKKEEGKKS